MDPPIQKIRCSVTVGSKKACKTLGQHGVVHVTVFVPVYRSTIKSGRTNQYHIVLTHGSNGTGQF